MNVCMYALRTFLMFKKCMCFKSNSLSSILQFPTSHLSFACSYLSTHITSRRSQKLCGPRVKSAAGTRQGSGSASLRWSRLFPVFTALQQHLQGASGRRIGLGRRQGSFLKLPSPQQKENLFQKPLTSPFVSLAEWVTANPQTICWQRRMESS